MQVTISPSVISGTITASASKSAMQRACAAALLRRGKTVLYNPGVSADDKAALEIIRQLGAAVKQEEAGTILIESNGVQPVGDTIHCGESGLSVRMFTPIAALSNTQMTVTGSGSLTKRPLQFFTEVLPQLGVACSSNNGLLPLQIKGPLRPAHIEVDGSLSSQFLTGLLMAYSAADAKDVTIRVKDLASKPYIDLTLKLMQEFWLPVPVNHDYSEFIFTYNIKGDTALDTLHYTVEGDWSGGAFLLVAGAVNGEVIVKGLDVFSTQADRAILQALIQAGANISIEETQITVTKSKLKPFHFNATDCPDLFPPLVALAAYCDGTSVIEGVSRLTHKESNRGLTVQAEFGKMGVAIELQDNLMLVKGGRGVKGASVHSHHDHRIAMACAVAALQADGDMMIDEAEAVNKSYPAFWEDIKALKADVKFTN
jgi:3-phosphoshikimate 1-carboxyvinyltransferase